MDGADDTHETSAFISTDIERNAEDRRPSLGDRAASPAMLRNKNVRKCERYCWLAFTHFPLVFVAGITTWAVWVEAQIGFKYEKGWIGEFQRLIKEPSHV